VSGATRSYASILRTNVFSFFNLILRFRLLDRVLGLEQVGEPGRR
jgi:hypothetical protein